MRRNVTLRFVVVGISGMFFVAVTLLGIVLVQTNKRIKNRAFGF